MPKTKAATALPITTAPSQSMGLGSASLDVAMVRATGTSAAAAMKKAQKIDGQDQRCQQGTGSQHSDYRAGPGDAGPDSDGLGSLVLRVRRRQQGQRGRHDESRTHSRGGPGEDQRGGVGPDRRHKRCRGEDDQPEHQSAAPAVPVADGPGRQQQARQRQGVAVHDPGQLRLAGRGLQGDVRERGVERDHRRDDQQHPEARDDQRPQPGPLRHLTRWWIGSLVKRGGRFDHDRTLLRWQYFRD